MVISPLSLQEEQQGKSAGEDKDMPSSGNIHETDRVQTSEDHFTAPENGATAELPVHSQVPNDSVDSSVTISPSDDIQHETTATAKEPSPTPDPSHPPKESASFESLPDFTPGLQSVTVTNELPEVPSPSGPVVDGGSAVGDGGSAVVDGGGAVVDGGSGVVDGGGAVVDGGAMVDGDDSIVDGGGTLAEGGGPTVHAGGVGLVKDGVALADSGDTVAAGGGAVVDNGALVDHGGTGIDSSGTVLGGGSAVIDTVDGKGGTLVRGGNVMDDAGGGVGGTVVDDPELHEEDDRSLSSDDGLLHDTTEPPGVSGSEDEADAKELADSVTHREEDPERLSEVSSAASSAPDQVAGGGGSSEGEGIEEGEGEGVERETVREMNKEDDHTGLLHNKEGLESTKDVQNEPQSGGDDGSREPKERLPSEWGKVDEKSDSGEGGEGGEDSDGDMVQLNSGQASVTEGGAGGGEGAPAGVPGEEAESSVGLQREQATENGEMNSALNVTDGLQPPEARGSHDAASEGLTNGNGASMLSGQQKEKSVFLRLSNRIRDLEENMSLFSSYLDQIGTG